MFKWLEKYGFEAHTRYFLFNWILYGIMVILSFVYVYARLDYVRSGPPVETTNQK
jgi:hypothetical protein